MHDYDSLIRLENKGLENKYEKILNLPSWYGIVNVKEGKLIIQLPSFCLAIFICRTRHSNRVAGVFLCTEPRKEILPLGGTRLVRRVGCDKSPLLDFPFYHRNFTAFLFPICCFYSNRTLPLLFCCHNAILTDSRHFFIAAAPCNGFIGSKFWCDRCL